MCPLEDCATGRSLTPGCRPLTEHQPWVHPSPQSCCSERAEGEQSTSDVERRQSKASSSQS